MCLTVMVLYQAKRGLGEDVVLRGNAIASQTASPDGYTSSSARPHHQQQQED